MLEERKKNPKKEKKNRYYCMKRKRKECRKKCENSLFDARMSGLFLQLFFFLGEIKLQQHVLKKNNEKILIENVFNQFKLIHTIWPLPEVFFEGTFFWGLVDFATRYFWKLNSILISTLKIELQRNYSTQ